jgi:hypothetical protein
MSSQPGPRSLRLRRGVAGCRMIRVVTPGVVRATRSADETGSRGVPQASQQSQPDAAPRPQVSLPPTPLRRFEAASTAVATPPATVVPGPKNVRYACLQDELRGLGRQASQPRSRRTASNLGSVSTCGQPTRQAGCRVVCPQGWGSWSACWPRLAQRQFTLAPDADQSGLATPRRWRHHTQGRPGEDSPRWHPALEHGGGEGYAQRSHGPRVSIRAAPAKLARVSGASFAAHS